MILFGLHGGLGNMLFALPAIKALSRIDTVDLYVEGDNAGCAELFSRCRYVRNVYGRGEIPKEPYTARFIGDVPPALNGPWKRCGWPRPSSPWYPRPEWAQIKKECLGNETEEDVSDWIEVPREKQIDFALVPGCKPGGVWERKRWPGFYQLALALESQRFSVEAFGQREEIEEAKLSGWWKGKRDLLGVADGLARARVAVSTDSGIGHLASSLGTPCVFIFTATSPVKGRPLGPHRIVSRRLPCAPCQSTPRWQECRDWRCQAIKVEEVMAVAVGLLERPIGESVP